MKNRRIDALLLIGFLLIMVSCMPPTSAPQAKPISGPVQKPTAEPTPVSEEDLKPTPEETTSKGTASEGELRAHLEIPESLPLGEPVTLRFFLINDTNSKLYVLNWFTPLEGIGGEIFRVKRDGVAVPYQGILASRADPSPEAYTKLDAGEMVSAEVDLADAFDFSIPGTYTIEFISPRISHIAESEAEMAKTLAELGPVQIPANEVTVKIGPGHTSSADSEALGVSFKYSAS